MLGWVGESVINSGAIKLWQMFLISPNLFILLICCSRNACLYIKKCHLLGFLITGMVENASSSEDNMVI